MKIKKILFLLFIYLLAFLSVYASQTDLLSFYCNEKIIEGITPRVEFSANLRVQADAVGKKLYIDFSECETYNKNSFIKVENIHIFGNNSQVIKFPKEKGEVQDIIEFRIKGNLIFHWEKYKSNVSTRVTLGKVYLKIKQDRKEVGTVDIVLDNLDIISLLKVNVKNNMDFGTIVAGEKVDTRENERTPARIDVEGTRGEKVKIIIPKSTKIENDSGDILLVNLRFREEENSKQDGTKKTIIKNIAYESSRNGIGKTDIVEIDGSVTTKRQSSGNYKGVFIVRVEYEN